MKLNIDTLVVLFSLMLPLFIFVFFRKWLEEKSSWSLLLTAFIAIAIVGELLTFFIDRNDQLYIFLINPLFSVLLFRLMYSGFIKLFNRKPIDTFFDFRKGLFWDRCFNLFYCLFITVVPMWLIFFWKMK